jgi:hypothetical protein
MIQYIVVKTQFEAIHRWSDCPFDNVSFLRNPHRHIFFVVLKFETSEDRQFEFIMVKREVESFLNEKFVGRDLGETSCETIAQTLLTHFTYACFASVFEDNENGVEVVR